MIARYSILSLFPYTTLFRSGIFAVLAKEVVARLGDGGWAVIRTPELYAAILVTIGGVAWSQSAFRAGPLTASMPALQVSQPVDRKSTRLNSSHANISYAVLS